MQSNIEPFRVFQPVSEIQSSKITVNNHTNSIDNVDPLTSQVTLNITLREYRERQQALMEEFREKFRIYSSQLNNGTTTNSTAVHELLNILAQMNEETKKSEIIKASIAQFSTLTRNEAEFGTVRDPQLSGIRSMFFTHMRDKKSNANQQLGMRTQMMQSLHDFEQSRYYFNLVWMIIFIITAIILAIIVFQNFFDINMYDLRAKFDNFMYNLRSSR